MPKTTHTNTYSIRKYVKNDITRYTIMLYYWKNGKRRMKRGGSAPTRARAEIEAKRLLNEIVLNNAIEKKDDTINGLLRRYKNHMLSTPINEEGYRAATKRAYTTNVEALINHTSTSILGKQFRSIDKNSVRKWVRDIINGKKTNNEQLSASRVDKLLDVLTNSKRGFFYWLEINGYFDGEREEDYLRFRTIVNELRPRIIRGTRVDRYLTYQEFNLFIDQRFWKKTKKDQMYRLAFLVLYYSGLRISELRCLTWGDIDLEERLININKSISLRILKEDKEKYLSTKRLHTPKTSEGQRYVPILSQLYEEIIKSYSGKRKADLIFHNDQNKLLSDNAFTAKLQTQLRRAKINKHLTPHDMRRSFAHYICYELKIGFEDAKNLMGHKDTKLLEEVYAARKKYETAQSLSEIIKKAEKDLESREETKEYYRTKDFLEDEEIVHEIPKHWK